MKEILNLHLVSERFNSDKIRSNQNSQVSVKLKRLDWSFLLLTWNYLILKVDFDDLMIS